MKFTLSWLKEHLDTKASLKEICDTLTMIGLEVESVTDKSAELAPFTVARIISAEKHPQADKLKLCKVESDSGELQIVCGAANARAGLYVALAKEGAKIPVGGMVIKKTKIRGVESCGMLCSAEELGLDMEGDGIIELPEAKIGESIVSVLGLDDPVIDVAVTPNRADALGVRGIGRDLAAAGVGILLPLEGGGDEAKPSRWGSSGDKTPTRPPSRFALRRDDLPLSGGGKSPISVSISTPNCLQFIGCYIKGVKNASSPDWMKKRLAAVGQKSISALVDITNYITIDLGRPLHVYDARKLKGNIVVRDAKPGETFKALDDKEYALEPGMCVIADDSGVLGLGGIIGGSSTGVDENTTDVFLEVALFNPTHVAKTGRALQIDTDARYRFERGVDVAFVETGARLALKMIKELCGGEASELAVAGKPPAWQREIAFSPERVKTLGGVEVSAEKCGNILASLGFTSHQPPATSHFFTPPSWRADVEGEADLIEEVLRIHGYGKIPATPLPKLPAIGKPALSVVESRARTVRHVLAARGFLEACTYSFLPHAQAKMFGGGAEALQLQNPISEELSDMRPSLLPNLLEAARKNTFRGFKDLALCEVGLQFADATPHGQRMAAAGIRAGRAIRLAHAKGIMKREEKPADAFDVKTDALALLATLGVGKCDITTGTPAWYHPGRSGALTLGGKIMLGYFGELHPAILRDFEIETAAAGFEIFLDAIPAAKAGGKARAALKLSDFQAVERDFAFVVDEKITAAEILKTLALADRNLITDVAIFDVYSGTGLPVGKKSVAVKVTLQSFERTLTEQDITTVSQAIVEAAKSFGGVLRQ